MSKHQTIEAENVGRASAPLPWRLQLAAIIAAAFYLHAICWTTVAPDMPLYQFPWYDHVVARGPLGAFAGGAALLAISSEAKRAIRS